jgi:hypothetical protein
MGVGAMTPDSTQTVASTGADESSLPTGEEEARPLLAGDSEAVADAALLAPDELVLDETIVINGIECRVARLKLREHLALGRILTHTAQYIDWAELVSRGEDMDTDMLFSLVISLATNIPEAENELVAFFRKVVYPVVPLSGDEFKVFFAYMDNPNMLEVVEIVRVIQNQERNNWKALGVAINTLIPLEMKKRVTTATKRSRAKDRS